jgi:hypothetical protein
LLTVPYDTRWPVEKSMCRFQVLEFREMTVLAKFGGGLVGFGERRGVRLKEVEEVRGFVHVVVEQRKMQRHHRSRC